jgi:SPOR domain
MMRWGFAVLVLANIGLLMWATWYRGGVGEVRAPNPVFHPEQMVPLSAPGVALRARKNERPEPSLVAAKPRPRCVSIGPFASAELADKAVLSLMAEKQAATRRSEERKLEGSYWVHLAPFTNRKQAEQRLKEIERLGIRDVLIMPDADGNPAISLGLFTQADNAQKRLQELAQKGVQAQQEIRYRTESLAWFDLRLPEPADAALERLRAVDWGVPGVEVRDAPCAPEPG